MVKYNINITLPPHMGIEQYWIITAAHLYRNCLAKAPALFMPLIFLINVIFSDFFNFNKLIPLNRLREQYYSNTGADAIIYKYFWNNFHFGITFINENDLTDAGLII